MQTMFKHTRDVYVRSSSGHIYTTNSGCITSDCTILKKAEGRRLLAEQARTALLEILRPGDTVHGIVRSVARSGMSRRIDFYKLADGGMQYLTGYIAQLQGSDDFDGGLRVNGCGMDMIFATVYELSHSLWPNGVPCAGDKCQSNDHSNGDRDRTPGKIHRDGGYALRSAQL